MFTHRYRYLIALLLSVYTFLNTEFCDLYTHFGIEINWYFALLTISAITFFTLEAGSRIEPLLKKNLQPDRQGLKWFIIFFLLNGLISSLFAICCVLIMGSGIHSYDLHENIIPIKLNLTYSWLVNLLFHLLNGIIYYVREYKTMQIKTATLQKLNREAELQIVRQQLNPHFLFNNLNVLSSLIMQNQPDANKFIEEFSNLYRYILSCPEKDLVLLDAEVKHIESYVYLLKKRFDKGIEFKFDLLPPSGGVQIVPASLQLLIENAIKHNTVSQSKPLMIRISQPDETQIEVCNNLQSRVSPNNGKGVGLQHIQMRYQMVTNKPVEIMSEGGFFTVKIPLINSIKNNG